MPWLVICSVLIFVIIKKRAAVHFVRLLFCCPNRYGDKTKLLVTMIRPDHEMTFVSEVKSCGLNLTDKYEYDEDGNIKKRIVISKF